MALRIDPQAQISGLSQVSVQAMDSKGLRVLGSTGTVSIRLPDYDGPSKELVLRLLPVSKYDHLEIDSRRELVGIVRMRVRLQGPKKFDKTAEWLRVRNATLSALCGRHRR